MRRFLTFITLASIALIFSCSSQKNSGEKTRPALVIFDTDIAGDYDDVGAMALLHAFADKGEAKILATLSCNAFETTVPSISVINTYFNRPEIPIGCVRDTLPNMNCPQLWAQAIIAKYPHKIRSNAQAEDAVKLYRKILSGQEDNSVTIISVGFLTNLANLLASGPDEFSDARGEELIKRKVKTLVSMATGLDSGKNSGREYNIFIHAKSSRKVLEEWPTEVVLSPFEVGEKIHTGIPLITNNQILNSPVKDAYEIALKKDNNTVGRMSWDQTAVLAGVRGIEPYFNTRKLNFRIEEDGTNTLIPGEKFTYLSLKQSPSEIQLLIENLMMHQPNKQ